MPVPTKFYDVVEKNASEVDGAIVKGIFRAGITKGAGTIVVNVDESVTLTGCAYTAPAPDPVKFGANPNGTFPALLDRPNGIARGEVQYDPSLRELRNNKTGRKMAIQGAIIYLTRSKVKDTGTGNVYTVINTPLGGPIS